MTNQKVCDSCWREINSKEDYCKIQKITHENKEPKKIIDTMKMKERILIPRSLPKIKYIGIGHLCLACLQKIFKQNGIQK